MRIFTAAAGNLLCITAALICFSPQLIRAEGEAIPTTSTESNNSVGLGLFSRFPLTVSASVRGGYDDNINTSHFDPQDSWFTNASLLLTYNLGTPRTTLSIMTTTGFTYYFATVDNQYEPDLNLALTLTHKASPRLTFNVTSYIAYQTEPDFQYALGTNRRAGNYFSTYDKGSAVYLWTPRFSTATSYTFGAVHYDSIASGLFEDRIENTLGNEFRFLVWPTTSFVAEYRFQVVSYDNEGAVIVPAIFDSTGALVSPAVLLHRDSTTHFLLAGVDHAFSSRLTASFRGGAEFRDYADIGAKNSPYFEGTVGYLLGKDTSVSWTARYGIEEGDVSLNPTRKTFRTGVTGRHNLTARVSASLSAYYTHDDYAETVTGTPAMPIINPSITEDTFDLAVSLRYALTHYMGMEAGYNYSDVSSGQVLREYSRNRVWGGFNVQF